MRKCHQNHISSGWQFHEWNYFPPQTHRCCWYFEETSDLKHPFWSKRSDRTFGHKPWASPPPRCYKSEPFSKATLCSFLIREGGVFIGKIIYVVFHPCNLLFIIFFTISICEEWFDVKFYIKWNIFSLSGWLCFGHWNLRFESYYSTIYFLDNDGEYG